MTLGLRKGPSFQRKAVKANMLLVKILVQELGKIKARGVYRSIDHQDLNTLPSRSYKKAAIVMNLRSKKLRI